jgi:dienelactone hydrolase
VFAHGFGTLPDLSPYTTLLARWAGAGYVVAAPLFPLTRSDAPGGPDLSDFPAQPADMVAVVDRMLADARSTQAPLAGMVDAAHIGAAGHSLGGVTVLGLVANSCCRDPRISAAVVMSGDPIVFPTGHPDFTSAPPLLLVHGNADPAVPYVSSIDAFNAAHGPKGLLTLLGGNHDAPVDPSGRAFSSVVRATTDFFDAYLKHSTGALARLGGDARHGVTTLTLAARPGSTATLARPAAPVLHLHATVTPNTGLADGQTVTVSWEGFAPGVSVNVLQCSRNPPRAAGDCDLKTGALLHPDPSGSGSFSLMVHTGVVGSGGGMCGASHPGCVVAVNQGGSLDPSSTVTVGISFATG